MSELIAMTATEVVGLLRMARSRPRRSASFTSSYPPIRPKKRLTELPRHAVLCVLACTVVAKNIPGHLGKFESVIEFSIGKETSVSGDLGAVELQPG